MSANPTQPNNPASEPAYQPANGGGLNVPPFSNMGGQAFAHGEAYGAAVTNNGLADCEVGQRGYVQQLNYFDPQHRNFDSDAHIPGAQATNFVGLPSVPKGETFSREPLFGPKLPFIPGNP
jgi:hypothetical protein